jgi:EmrB/QacA subfamily drug resistance transporter
VRNQTVEEPRIKFLGLIAEPPRPRWLARRADAPWWAVGTVCIGAFMGQLDASIVSLALPTLHRVFSATVAEVEWVSLAYLLTLIATVVPIGRLADMTGRKLLYTYGFAVFIVGSGLCGLAPDLPILITARIIQAFGAAMLQANSVALIVEAVPRDKLGRAIGIQGAAQAVGLALGPAVGGLLIALSGWRLIFYVNVPAGLLGLALGWFFLPRSRNLQPMRRFDWKGATLFALFVVPAMLALSFSSDLGWLSLPILAAGAAGAAGLVLFLRRETRARAPLIDLSMFRRVPFSAGIGGALFSYLVLFGVLFVTPFYLEEKRHLSTAEAGLLLTAVPVALGVVAPVMGRLSDRYGSRLLTAGGMLLAAVGLLLMARFREPEVVLIGELGLIGIGLGAFVPANNAATMSSAPRTHSGVAGGIINLTRGLGTSLGVAATGLVFTLASAGLSSNSSPADAALLAHGFAVACIFLAVCSLVAAGISLLRGNPSEPAASVAASH